MDMDIENLSEINHGDLFYTLVIFNRPFCVNNLEFFVLFFNVFSKVIVENKEI